MLSCIQCGKQKKQASYIYCSNKCQLDHQYQTYISEWKLKKISGGRGVNAKNISGHVRRYLFDKYDNTCTLCDWSEINPITGRTPLEVDHIDGDSENNIEENLRLLCPNCHSLTSNFRNLNRGKGRAWRRDKYIKTI